MSRLALAGTVGLLAAGLAGGGQSWSSELVVENGVDPSLSPDGTKVAFTSYVPLLPIDTNGASDVYLRDLRTGTFTLVSTNAAGTTSANGFSSDPVFSPDGTRIAFSSTAGDLGPTDTNGIEDVYVRPLHRGRPGVGRAQLVSVNAAGTDGGDDYSSSPVFSPDGTQLAFTSDASNLGPRDANATTDVYLRHLRRHQTTLVSVNAAGTSSAPGSSSDPSFSGDGRRIVFSSFANDLVAAPDSNGRQDVFVRSLTARTTTLVSVNAAGTSGNGGSYAPVISQDGTKVAFHSSASDLGSPDGNDADDVFVRDLTARTTTLVSVNAAGTSGNDASGWPVLSPDGTKVAFVSGASDLGPPDPRPTYDIDFDVYVRDLSTGTMTLVSVNAAGTDGGNGWSQNPVFSPDGDTIAFDSYATDLGPRDTNTCGPNPTDPSPPCTDIYARHLPSATTGLVSAAGDDSRPRTSSSNPVFHPSDSAKITFTGIDYDVFVTSTYVATLERDAAASMQRV